MALSLNHALAAGDPAAFAALYDRLAGRLLRTAIMMTASPADAEDIVHDVFVELARHRTRLAAVTDLRRRCQHFRAVAAGKHEEKAEGSGQSRGHSAGTSHHCGSFPFTLSQLM